MYLMSYFKDAERKMFIAESDNLLEWKDLNDGKPVFAAGGGNFIRDPFLIKDKQGKWHMFFTNKWYSQSIGHAVSDDLLNWTELDEIVLFPGNDDVHNCWAPECYWDEKSQRFNLVWSTSFKSKNEGDRVDSIRIWYAVSDDLMSFSEPKLLFDPGYPVIDSSIVEYNGLYYMAFKDERDFNKPGSPYSAIRTAIAEKFEGPYEQISPILTNWRSEGPMLIRENDQFYVFYDAFGEGIYRCMVSKDFKNWTDITSSMKFPDKCKHACITRR